MEKQTVINAISVLVVVLDTMNRAKQKEAIDVIVKKILELIEQL